MIYNFNQGEWGSNLNTYFIFYTTHDFVIYIALYTWFIYFKIKILVNQYIKYYSCIFGQKIDFIVLKIIIMVFKLK